MTISDLREYLTNRINAEGVLALPDDELIKYLTTAENIINTVYDIPDKTVAYYIPTVGEQVLFLINNNIDLNIYYEYSGMTSFNIAGAISGTVDYKTQGDVIAPMARLTLEANGVDKKVDTSTDHHTAFAIV